MTNESSTRKPLIVVAWIFLLLASALPKIILQEVFHQTVSEDSQFMMAGGIILLGLILTFAWQAIRPLRIFLILFLVLVITEWFVYTKIDQLPFYQAWLNDPSFNVYMLAEQSLRFLVTLIIIAALFLLRKHSSAFFMIKGDTNAPVEPVKWLGIKAGEHWNKFGRMFTIFISLAHLPFLFWQRAPRSTSS